MTQQQTLGASGEQDNICLVDRSFSSTLGRLIRSGVESLMTSSAAALEFAKHLQGKEILTTEDGTRYVAIDNVSFARTPLGPELALSFRLLGAPPASFSKKLNVRGGPSDFESADLPRQSLFYTFYSLKPDQVRGFEAFCIKSFKSDQSIARENSEWLARARAKRTGSN